MLRASLLLAILAVVGQTCAALASEISYQPGDTSVFNVVSYIDGSGHQEDQRSGGVRNKLLGTAVSKCTETKDGGFLLAFNMFNTKVSADYSANGDDDQTVESMRRDLADFQEQPDFELVSTGLPAGISAMTASMGAAGLSDAEPLGYDMYYLQHGNGTISKVWYNSADSEYYKQIKLGVISSLQTNVTPAAATSKATLSDPLGVHTSEFTGTSEDELLHVEQTYDADSVHVWSDKNLNSNQVVLGATGKVSIHSSGRVVAMESHQNVTVVADGANTEPSVFGLSNEDGASLDSFNIKMGSRGKIAGTINSSLTEAATTHAKANLHLELFSSSDLENLSTFVSPGLLHEAAAELLVVVPTALEAVEEAAITQAAVDALLEDEDLTTAQRFSVQYRALRGLRSHESVAQPVLDAFVAPSTPEEAQAVFFLLSQTGTPAAEAVLVRLGLNSDNAETQLSAILSAAYAKTPTDLLVSSMMELAFETTPASTSSQNPEDESAVSPDAIQRFAVLAVASMVSSLEVSSPAHTLVSSNIASAIRAATASNHADLTLLVRAAGNLGDLEGSLAEKEVTSALFDTLTSSSNLQAVEAAAEILGVTFEAVEEGDFPFNVTKGFNSTFGGDEVGAFGAAEIFAGTNFDCNHESFNFKGEALLQLHAHAFGKEIDVFKAEAIYGQANGSPLADDIDLIVLGKTMYHKDLTALFNCKSQTYPIAKYTAPGLDVSYTVWVSVVPVNFGLSAAFSTELTWGWDVCLSNLSADVHVDPKGALTIAGHAEVNLLIIKAGVELGVDFNTKLQPELAIKGTLCEIEASVREVNPPMDAFFNAYLNWKKCKFLIFDCKWGTRKTWPIFSWSAPANNHLVYDKIWKIAKAIEEEEMPLALPSSA